MPVQVQYLLRERVAAYDLGVQVRVSEYLLNHPEPFAEYRGREPLDLPDVLYGGIAATARDSLGKYVDLRGTLCDLSVEGGQDEGFFKRGDSDGSGTIDLTDPIFVLRYLFMGGERPACMDAADCDDSGALDLTDAVSALEFLFMGGARPPDPGPSACGPDTTPAPDFAPCAYPEDACRS